MTYKPFPPLRQDESTTVTGEEATRINAHCQAMADEIDRLERVLDYYANCSVAGTVKIDRMGGHAYFEHDNGKRAREALKQSMNEGYQ